MSGDVHAVEVIVHYVSINGAPDTVTISAFSTDDYEDVKALSMIAVEELGTFIRFEVIDDGEPVSLFKNTMH